MKLPNYWTHYAVATKYDKIWVKFKLLSSAY